MTRTTIAIALLAVLVGVACGTSFEGKDLPEISVAMSGSPGETQFTFNNVEPGKQATAEVSVNNIGQQNLEIYAVRTGTAQREEGDATGGTYLLRNQVADAASLKVWVNGSSCDEGWTLIANDRGLEFDEAGECPLVAGDNVEVEYEMVPNPKMVIDFKGKVPPSLEAPFVLEPKDLSPFTSFDFDVVYSPDNQAEGGDFVVIIETNDTERGDVVLTFHASSPTPRISIYPPSKTFLNLSYECQEFTISNNGNADLVFEGVRLEATSNLYQVKDWPNSGDVVPPKGSPLTFKVCYTPKGDATETNRVMVASNDPLSPETIVVVSNSPEVGAFSVSYADQGLGYLDFTSIEHGTLTKEVVFYTKTKAECTAEGSSCGGSVKLVDVRLDPPQADQAYTWVLRRVLGADQFEDITTSADKDALIQAQKFLTAVSAGKSVQIALTYDADVFPTGLNATLSLDVSTPTSSTVDLSLFGGDPQPEFDLAPQHTQLHFNTTGTEAKTLRAAVYNHGNGPLTINRIEVTGKWVADSLDFKMGDPTQAGGLTMEPFSVLLIPVTFTHLSGDFDPAGRLSVYYDEPGIGELPISVDLMGHPNLGVAFPVAKAEVSGATGAGATATLSGAGSTPTPGGDIYEYIWFLSAKPTNSKARLNTITSTATTTFIPDVAGSYEVALVVYNVVENQALFSDPATLGFTVP